MSGMTRYMIEEGNLGGSYEKGKISKMTKYYEKGKIAKKRKYYEKGKIRK
jgi:hypothetical protein